MLNQVFYTIARKLSAHLVATCIFCTILLMLFVGGLVQVLSLKNDSNMIEITFSSTLPASSLSLSPNLQLDKSSTTTNRDANRSNGLRNKLNFDKSDGQTSIVSIKDNQDDDERSFLNTKILYKPYSAAQIKQQNKSAAVAATAAVTKSKTINSTVFKSVTPSITDRVIADLKKEEQLAAARDKFDDSVTETNDNDDAIYIDGDEDDEANTVDSIVVDSDGSLKDYITNVQPIEQKNDPQPTITIVARDKKSSSKKPITITKHFKSFSADNSDSDDDDDYYDYSGSGDQMIEQPNIQDWVIPIVENIEKLRSKKKPEMKISNENAYDIDGDGGYQVDRIEFDDDGNLQIQQQLSKKIARAHKKEHLMHGIPAKTNNNNEKQKKTRLTHQQQIINPTKNKNNNNNNKNNHRKSKEQHYIDEYFNGKKNENTVESLENTNPNGWIEPRIRRILGNIKKSEERSQQILLCKGEGELCSMLFKTPNKPIATP